MLVRIRPTTVTEIRPEDAEHCGDCDFHVAHACYPCCGTFCSLFGAGLTSGREDREPNEVAMRLPECIEAEKAASATGVSR